MSRRLLLEWPALLAAGALASRWTRLPPLRVPGQIAALLFVLGSVAFWMLPLSVDRAVGSAAVDQAFHLCSLASGFCAARALPRASFEIRALFLATTWTMIGVAGFVLSQIDTLVCSVYTLEQQRLAGGRLAVAGALGLALSCVFCVRALARAGPRQAPAPRLEPGPAP